MGHGEIGNHPAPPAPQLQKEPQAWMMGAPVALHAISGNGKAAEYLPPEHASAYAAAGPPASPCWWFLPPSNAFSTPSGNPYVNVSSVPSKSASETFRRELGRCGKKLEDSTKKAGGAAGNFWHHLKTSPSFTDAAMARLAQGTKVFAGGGNEKVFQQKFAISPGEKLQKAYASYLSTSAGPVMGTLYLSTAKIAFSDNFLCHNISNGQKEWAYYEVVVPLDQLSAANASANPRNPSEKYIQIITMDNHEFWFMGFISYEKALKNVREALQPGSGPHGSQHHKI